MGGKTRSISYDLGNAPLNFRNDILLLTYLSLSWHDSLLSTYYQMLLEIVGEPKDDCLKT